MGKSNYLGNRLSLGVPRAGRGLAWDGCLVALQILRLARTGSHYYYQEQMGRGECECEAGWVAKKKICKAFLWMNKLNFEAELKWGTGRAYIERGVG